MAKHPKPVLTKQHTIYLTPTMLDHIRTLAARQGKGYQVNDFIRDAIRSYLDQQEDLVGSRRHFQKQFQARIDLLEANMLRTQAQSARSIHFYLHVVLHILAFSFAKLLSAVAKGNITPQDLLQKGMIDARREEVLLDAQVQTLRQMRAPETSSQP